MHNRYGADEYRKIITNLKIELQNVRKEIGDTDEDNPRIRKVIDAHWEN